MESRVTELDGKRYTVFFMGEEDKGLSLFYTPGDESVVFNGLTIVKPTFRDPSHPEWVEITKYDKPANNLRIICRIQVEDL